MLDPFRDRLDGEPDAARLPTGPAAPSLRAELLGVLGPAPEPDEAAEVAAPSSGARFLRP